MLNRPLVLPLALLYLALEGWLILMALLGKGVPPQTVTVMRLIVWAGAIDGLYWLATSPWGAGPPPPDLDERTFLSRVLGPFSIRADAISRCDTRTWASLALRLLMVCGLALVASRGAVMVVVVIFVICYMFGLLNNYYVAVGVFWLLLFTLTAHMHFMPLASLIVLVVPLLLIVQRSPGDVRHGMVAMVCACLGLLWEYQGFEQPPSWDTFLMHILQTASNLAAMLPGLFLGCAVTQAMATVDPG